MSQRARKPRTNQLRHLLDHIARNEGFDSSLEDNERAVTNATAALGEQAVCFMGGPVESSLSFRIEPDLCRLPFPVCWFEFEMSAGNQPWRSCILASEIDGVRRAIVYSLDSSGWALWSCATVDDWHPTKVGFVAGSAEAGFVPVLNTLSGFLTALNCRNVRQQRHDPARNRAQMRHHQGKPPLFSYWTLRLGPASDAAPYQGGTHASPRVHLRRGHPRQYAPSQWTWVQPHAVGNAQRGVVQKDYDGRGLAE